MGISTVMINGCAKDGATGPAGKNGNANVNSSQFTVSPFQWQTSGGSYVATYTAPAITNGNNDAVMLYLNSSSQWIALPYSSIVVSGDNLGFAYSTNNLTLIYQPASGTSPSNTWTFKQVVIPPAAMVAHPNVNLNNYMEVKKAFNLPN